MRPSVLLLLVLALLIACSSPDSPSGARLAVHFSATEEGPPPPPPPPPPFPIDDPTPPLPSDPFGYLDGHSAITPTGEYTYTLPIAVPPGRAGMQPSLALTYGSRGSSAIAGVGWTLAGLSEIRRCGHTLATEGDVDGIDFDATDRFCLDGQKLIVVSGSYGDHGAEYRTERDPFARIISYTIAGAPWRFEVHARDGRILTYKERLAYRVAPAAAEPHHLEPLLPLVTARWLLSEIRDRDGNTIRYHYHTEQDLTEPYAAEILLERIDYTHHGPGDDGRRSVVLHYEPRPDAAVFYEAGLPARAAHRLERVELYAPHPDVTALVGTYHLDYTLSPITGRSLLHRVQRCDAEGVCLWGRSFAYEAAARPDFEIIDVGPIEFPEYYFSMFQGDPTFHVFDADGDGRDDLLYHIEDAIYLRRSEPGSPLGQRVHVNPPAAAFAGVQLAQSRPVDIDGDGQVELLAARVPPYEYKLFRWNPAQARFDPEGAGIPVAHDGAGVLAAAQITDLDGDGRPDLVHQELVSGHFDWAIRMNNGQGFGPAQLTGVAAPCGASARGADIDGDGRGELLGAVPGCFHSQLLGLADSGALALDPGVDLGYSAEQAILADLNGDGLRDAVFLDTSAHVR